MTHHHEGCQHTPAEIAQFDQVVAGFKFGVDGLVKIVGRYLDEGDDEATAAASLAMNLSITCSVPRMSSLLGFAVVRLVEQRRAEMCPCLPDAPAHEHLTGGYALSAEDRAGVEWRLAHGQPAWPTDEARP